MAAGLALVGLAAFLDHAVRPAPRLVWNPSASAPVGLWRVHLGAAVGGGDMVRARTPEAVHGRMVARRHAADAQERPLPRRTGCRTLRDYEVLLLMDAADSFDGHYFGPVECSAIIGEATPLWTG